MSQNYSFPKSFHFGSATSSYQIEGAVNEDGRKPSIWDEFAHKSGRIADHSTGDIACDHYHRWPEDLALMSKMNFDAYRFSIAWPRVIPDGRGAVNQQGLDFYDRLVDALLERGIAPYATLYHWDLPLALPGGWLNRDTAKAFAEYTEVVVRRLGDRVHSWATLNEPRCSATVGYQEGRHAPGEMDRTKALTAAHNLLLAHGMAVPVLRAATKKAKVGIVLDIKPYYPASVSNTAAQAAIDGDGVFNRWFFDPIAKGRYPADTWAGFGEHVPTVEDGDMALISAPIDSVGLNYYSRGFVEQDTSVRFPHAKEIRNPASGYTEMGWEIYPQGLHDMLVRLHRDYPEIPDFYIAENGAAMADELVDGKVSDPVREQYYRDHIQAVSDAIGKGVPMSAYLAWSFMDNFEWGFGYTRRFGIVYVDYPTQQRVVKQSGQWFADFIAAQKALR